MTTIAYRAGVIAGDGRATEDDAILSDVITKVGRIRTKRGSILFGSCGQAAWGWSFRSWLRQGAKKADMPKPEKSNTGMLIHGRRILTLAEFGWEIDTAPYTAMGSGAPYALGAMAAGSDAAAAVRHAGKHDPFTGGRILVLRR